MENCFRANIHVDPLGRFGARIDDHKIEFRQEVPVSLQGDRYMDPYATMYLIVEDPHNYTQYGIKENKNKGKSPMVEMEAPPSVDPNLFCMVNSTDVNG